jgi:creatinine amidohydrolase
MILSSSTWKEVSDFIDDSVVAVVPLGAIEQHGLHLPINTDAFNSEQFARRGVERVGDSAKILLLPTFSYGVSTTHMAFPGTVTLSAETYIHAVKDICRSLVKHHVKRIVLLNGHVGNSAPLAVVCTEINVETGAGILLVNWWDLCADSIRKNFGFMFHACEAETSVSLALGQSVHQDRASGKKPSSGIDLVKYNMFIDGPRIQQASIRILDELSPTGAVGEPEKMDLRKGEEIVEVALERLARLLVEFSSNNSEISKRAYN